MNNFKKRLFSFSAEPGKLTLTLKLSLRNIWRHFRRTSVTMAAVATGVLTMIFFNSYIATMEMGLRANAIEKQYGHYQIALKGYFEADENSFRHLIPKKTLDHVLQNISAMEQVSHANTRIHVNGIIGTGESSTIFAGIAGEPLAEALMSPTIAEGSPLSPSDPSGIVMGQSMAKKLQVGIGDNLVAFVATPYGSQEAILVTLRGIYRSILPEQEKIMIYLPLQAARDLLLEDGAHRILVFLNRAKETPQTIAKTKRQLETIIQKKDLPADVVLEVRHWEELAIFVRQVIGMFKGMSFVVTLILFLVIIFNIRNTIHISIHERFQEIGALRAMGASRIEIVTSFLSEGFYIGFFGAAAGALLALLLIPAINSSGFSLPPGPGQTEPTPLIFSPNAFIVAKAVLINICIAFLASLLPALQGARIKIVKALRYV